jgi:hypothetical protein
MIPGDAVPMYEGRYYVVISDYAMLEKMAQKFSMWEHSHYIMTCFLPPSHQAPRPILLFKYVFISIYPTRGQTLL